MRRTLRISFFFCLALAVWSFSSEKVLSRITTDEGLEDATPDRLDGEDDGDYQVVRLLSKLFTLIKRHYLEVLSLHGRLGDERDAARRDDLRRQLAERIATLDAKGAEYRRLEPTLRQQYPKLRPVMASFTKDLSRIGKDLERVKRLEAIPATGDMTVPITLEIRGSSGQQVPNARVVFQVVRDARDALKGILDDRGGLVMERATETDGNGKATVRIQIGSGQGPVRIKRTIVPQSDHTVCRLETVAAQ